MPRVPEPEPEDGRQLDEQVAEGARDDADRKPGHPERRREEERRPDDREVVDDRGDGGGGEPALGVEEARRDRSEGEEDRAEQHDPRQLDGSERACAASKPGVIAGTIAGAATKDERREQRRAPRASGS